MTIDPITLARFMVMPGAAELVDAFSRVPEGKLRASIIAHAQAMAETYDDARAEGAPIPDPLMLAARSAPAPSLPALAQPAHALRMDSKEAQAVALRLEGREPLDIARELKMPLDQVNKCLTEARKAGVRVPRQVARAKRDGPVFITEASQLAPQGMGAMVKAAKKRGITVEAYLRRRAKMLAMTEKGHSVAAIVEATKESEGVIRQWMTLARSAGHKIGYDFPVRTAEVEDLPAAKKWKPARFIMTVEDIPRSARVFIERSAQSIGVDLERLMELRREALICFRRGETAHAISERLGVGNRQMVANWKFTAGRAGLLDPPTPVEERTYS